MTTKLKQQIIDSNLEINHDERREFINWLIAEWDFDCYDCEQVRPDEELEYEIDKLEKTVHSLQKDKAWFQNKINELEEEIENLTKARD